MKLVIGGFAVGKRRSVQEKWGYQPEELSQNLEAPVPVLFDLQELCRGNAAKPEVLLAKLLKKEVVICNEVGCGVVPMTAEDRLWRENVGRLCVELASNAIEVWRVYCGVMIKIKG